MLFGYGVRGTIPGKLDEVAKALEALQALARRPVPPLAAGHDYSMRKL
jgi:hypothetical protein